MATQAIKQTLPGIGKLSAAKGRTNDRAAAISDVGPRTKLSLGGVLWLSMVLSSWTSKGIITVQAQQRPFTNVAKFDSSISYRTDLCPRQIQIWDGTLEFADGLRGLNLTVAVTNHQAGKEKFLFSLKDGRIPVDDPGYFAIILDEVARRAGFSWRDSFATYEPRNIATDGNKTWTDILLWSIEVFDISMEKWGQSIDRMALGVSFPVGFFDSSLVIGELYQPNQSKPKVDLWSFLKPFAAHLWLTIVATVIVSGLVYWLLEHWNKDADELELDTKPIASIFYTSLAVTGHYEFSPQTHSARLLGFSLTFWALIVSASYTANLASFLVTPRVQNYKYSTVEEAAAKKASLCVQDGAILQKIIEEMYPDVTTVGKDSEIDIFTALRLPKSEGGCDAVAHQLNIYELYEHEKQVRSDEAICMVCAIFFNVFRLIYHRNLLSSIRRSILTVPFRPKNEFQLSCLLEWPPRSLTPAPLW